VNITDIGGNLPYFLINYLNPGVCLEEVAHIYEIGKKDSKKLEN
jgi:hypothetical protein